MRKLSTIQKRNNLNEVFYAKQEGPGGAHHDYVVKRVGAAEDEAPLLIVTFQTGPRNAETSVAGVLDGDLLEMVRDRLRSFQDGPFACEDNEHALEHVEAALLYMAKRADDRAERGVLGKSEK